MLLNMAAVSDWMVEIAGKVRVIFEGNFAGYKRLTENILGSNCLDSNALVTDPLLTVI